MVFRCTSCKIVRLEQRDSRNSTGPLNDSEIGHKADSSPAVIREGSLGDISPKLECHCR